MQNVKPPAPKGAKRSKEDHLVEVDTDSEDNGEDNGNDDDSRSARPVPHGRGAPASHSRNGNGKRPAAAVYGTDDISDLAILPDLSDLAKEATVLQVMGVGLGTE